MSSMERSICSSPSTNGILTPTSSEAGGVDWNLEVVRENPGQSRTRRTSTSTARSFLQRLQLGDNAEEAQPESPEIRAESARRLALSPNSTASTYADLHNATPTPGTRSVLQQTYRNGQSQPLRLSPRTPSITTRLEGLEIGENETQSDRERDANHESFAVSEAGEGGSQTYPEYDPENEDDHQYNIRQEQLPRARIYNSRLQNILKDVKQQFGELQHTMSDSPLSRDESSDLYGLYRQLESLSRFDYPETRTVGFIGDSGVGECFFLLVI